MLETTAPEKALGARFRNARESLGISVGEAAESLHIIPRYVRCMESGDYSQLPGVVFLKGYAKGYARLLELPEDQMMALLDAALESKAYFAETADRFAALPKEQASTHHGKWLLLGVLLVVGSGVSYWWNRADERPVNVPEQYVEEQHLEEQHAEEPKAAEPESVEEPPSEVLGYAENQVSAQPEMSIVPVPEAAAGIVEPSVSSTVPLEVSFAASSDPKTPTSSDPEAPAELAGADKLPVSSEAPTAGQLTAVEVMFHGDCWFDIRDARNERIVQLFRSGQTVTFSGQRPIHVIAGAADAVEIRVNGHVWGLDQYKIWNNRVEFVLEP